jgi:hypothetical protein
MASSYDQTPGTLNLSFARSDDFSALVDFSIPLTSYTVTAAMTSLVSGAQVQPFTVTMVSAANGQVNIALTDTQTAALARGTYGWSMAWTVDSATRTALTGFVEVL